MKALRCCAVVALLNLVSGSDFSERSSVAHLSLAKDLKLRDARDVRKRSMPTSPEFSVGTADPGGDSCGALREYDATLNSSTHPYVFRDLSGSVSLAWVGDGTGVILALTTYQVPIFMLRFGQSKLYRSTNYGKFFDDVTNLINNTFIRSEFGIAVGPENSGKVILTADVPGSQGISRIFLSKDFGKSFMSSDLSFEPVTQISYNPSDSEALLAVSSINDLWLSEDFGKNWRNIHHSVCLVKWGRNGAIFFTTSLNRSCSDRGMLELRSTTDYGKTFKTLGTKIYSFGVGGRFLFASVMADSDTLRVIHVSLDQGDTWNIAQLPAVGHEQFYSILAASDDMVFMHVDEPGDSGFGTIYVSDDRGVVYSKSLERHLYSTTGGDTDFTNITSLRGVFMTTVLAEDGSLQTVVTFDQGGEWRPLQKPAEGSCDGQLQSQEQMKTPCTFYIHASYSISAKLNVPMLPLTEPNAVGLILAHGSMGDVLSVMEPDVYVSDDGGYSWQLALKGPHHYAILDSGGLLVAVEHTPSQTIQQIKFSTDEGQCWHVYNFTKEPIYFSGLASEPGARSMNVSLWGYRENLFSQFWVSITIDFKELLRRDCNNDDYVEWLAHSDDISDPNDGCMLGYKEKFLRLRKDSVCLNGRDYVINKQPLPCQCTLDDFLCDFGYYRVENSSECVEQPDLQGKVLEFCLQGKMEQLQTKGYRKIPGDKCEGGVAPERSVIDLSSRCVSNILVTEKQTNTSTSSTALIILVVICTLLISVAAGVLFIKRYVCGGRFLVHRYSVLQQHADANGIETADALDTCAVSSSRRQYHDDSDEDLLD